MAGKTTKKAAAKKKAAKKSAKVAISFGIPQFWSEHNDRQDVQEVREGRKEGRRQGTPPRRTRAAGTPQAGRCEGGQTAQRGRQVISPYERIQAVDKRIADLSDSSEIICVPTSTFSGRTD